MLYAMDAAAKTKEAIEKNNRIGETLQKWLAEVDAAIVLAAQKGSYSVDVYICDREPDEETWSAFVEILKKHGYKWTRRRSSRSSVRMIKCGEDHEEVNIDTTVVDISWQL